MNATGLERETVSGESGPIRLRAEVGTGAEGIVYQTEGSTAEVVKIFKRNQRADKADKIAAMIANPPTDPTLDHRGKRSIVWPTGIVKHSSNGSFLGYTMPYMNLDAHKNAQRYAREDLQWSETSAIQRYKTALNLASVVDAIHQQDHAMGDFNHQNVLIEHGYVSLIDCDAFHIQGESDVFKGHMVFPRYTPPEGRGSDIRDVRRGDRFGLGVHIFQLLMEGFHPFQAHGSKAATGGFGEMIGENSFPYKDPRPGELEPHPHAPEYSQLPSEVRDKFADCFVLGKGRGRNRPPAIAWVETLRQACGISTTSEAKKDRVEKLWPGDEGNDEDDNEADRTARESPERAADRFAELGWSDDDPSETESPEETLSDNDTAASSSDWVNDIRNSDDESKG